VFFTRPPVDRRIVYPARSSLQALFSSPLKWRLLEAIKMRKMTQPGKDAE
jgi:hypothetical protein